MVNDLEIIIKGIVPRNTHTHAISDIQYKNMFTSHMITFSIKLQWPGFQSLKRMQKPHKCIQVVRTTQVFWSHISALCV